MSIAVSAVDWLLESDEPGIVMQAKRDLLDERLPAESARVLDGPKVRALLAGQQPRGFRLARLREVGWRPLAARVARRARRPGRGAACLAAAETFRLADQQGPCATASRSSTG